MNIWALVELFAITCHDRKHHVTTIYLTMFPCMRSEQESFFPKKHIWFGFSFTVLALWPTIRSCTMMKNKSSRGMRGSVFIVLWFVGAC